jgi:SAM-dependent methyltransferase
MGRYSRLLAPLFADFAGVVAPMNLLEVGSGPGALTTELVQRLGASSVTATDPSQPFVAAVRERLLGVEARQALAEALPFGNHFFDVALAQLVVHHMTDPVAGVREMGRVTRAGGTVAACVWDLADGRAPLGPFWRAVKRFDPDARDESHFPGAGEGELMAIFEASGIEGVQGDELVFEVSHESFEEWWEPFTLGVGPAGSYVARLDRERRGQLVEMCRDELPPAPFTLSFRVWAARGSSPAQTM